METRKCPECDDMIGGTNHRLNTTNRLATHMDQASYPAWSDIANNFGNWHLDENDF